MNEIINQVSQGGMIMVGAIAVFLAYKYFMGKMTIGKINKPVNHDFFNKIIYERDMKLPVIKLNHKGKYCQGRTEIFKDMLRTKYTKWHDSTKQLMMCECLPKLTSTELHTKVISSIMLFVDDYEKSWKDEGIPEIVISRFKEWHEQHTTILVSAISSICVGQCFNTNEEKLNAVLEIHKALIILTVLDAENTLGNLNGELSGLKYKKFTMR